MQQQQNKIERSPLVGDSIKQFLTFNVSGERYAIDIVHIKEIIEQGHITKVPMSPDFIAGVVNLRGSVVPVIDLAKRFEKKPEEQSKKSSIVILEVKYEGDSLEIGITVDLVNEVLDVRHSDIELAPSFGTKIRTDFIDGMGKIENGLLTILDINTVLSIDELSNLS